MPALARPDRIALARRHAPTVTPKTASSVRRNLLFGFWAILTLMIPFTAGSEKAGGRMDEGSLLVYPELISHGAMAQIGFPPTQFHRRNGDKLPTSRSSDVWRGPACIARYVSGERYCLVRLACVGSRD